MKLKLVIDNIDSSEFTSPGCCAESDFIEAALHAAKHSKSNRRADILKDVSLILNCESEDLGFLFHAKVDQGAAQIYKLDLPDYRLRTSDVYLEAAE